MTLEVSLSIVIFLGQFVNWFYAVVQHYQTVSTKESILKIFLIFVHLKKFKLASKMASKIYNLRKWPYSYPIYLQNSLFMHIYSSFDELEVVNLI